MRTVLIILLITVLAGQAFLQTQTPTPPLVSEQEKTEAIRVARLFTRRMKESQDIEPLLSEFFAPEFLAETRKEQNFNFFALIKPELVLDRKLQDRFYLAVTNFTYRGWIYSCAKNPGRSEHQMAPFPNEIKSIMKNSRVFRYMLPEADGSVDDDDNDDFIGSVAEVEQITSDAEIMNTIFKKHLKWVRRLSMKTFFNRVEKCNVSPKFFHVEIVKCDGFADCHGLPKTSRLIGVSVPGFTYLDFVRINGRMKILRLFIFEDD